MAATLLAGVKADVVAWAVVASARTYGDDPLAAMTAQGRGARRAMPAAICAVARATGAQPTALALKLGVLPQTVRAAKASGRPEFVAAEAAAWAAVQMVLEDEGEAPEVAPQPQPQPQPQPEPELEPVAPIPTNLAPAPGFKPMPVIYRGDPVPSAPLGARILAALTKAPGTPRGLATVLDAKEELVGREITRLAHEGMIVAGDMPESGRRDQRWKLVKR